MQRIGLLQDDRGRLRIAKEMEGFGRRVQKSVFDCHLREKGLARLQHLLEKLTASAASATSASIATCYGASLGIGEVDEGTGGEPCIIV